MIQGVPEMADGRIRLRLHRFVPFGPEGSTIEATPSGLRISGAPFVSDVRLERGARITAGWIVLSHPADAVAFRTGAGGASTVRLVGSLLGKLRIETPFGSTSLPASGDFDLDLPLQLARKDDVYVRAEAGELRLARIEIGRAGLKP